MTGKKKTAKKKAKKTKSIEAEEITIDYVDELAPVISSFIQKIKGEKLTTKDDIYDILNTCQSLTSELSLYKRHLDLIRSDAFVLERKTFASCLERQEASTAEERKALAQSEPSYAAAKENLAEIDANASFTMRSLSLIEDTHTTHLELLNSLDWGD